MHTHRVTEIAINKTLPYFGDAVVVHQAFKKPPSFENCGVTGVCLGHDSRIAGGVVVVSVVNGDLKEVCSAKVHNLGEKVGQAWRLHVHCRVHPKPRMSTAQATSSGTCMRLKFLPWNKVFVRMLLNAGHSRTRFRMGVVCQ